MYIEKWIDKNKFKLMFVFCSLIILSILSVVSQGDGIYPEIYSVRDYTKRVEKDMLSINAELNIYKKQFGAFPDHEHRYYDGRVR